MSSEDAEAKPFQRHRKDNFDYFFRQLIDVCSKVIKRCGELQNLFWNKLVLTDSLSFQCCFPHKFRKA
jgi:hypothetical protein